MKPYLTCVSALLLAGMLVSCGGGDSASGGSNPATSNNGSPGAPNDGNPGSGSGGPPSAGAPSAGVHVEESDTAAVTFSGDWKPADDEPPGDCRGNACSFGWSGGKAKKSKAVGALASFTFTGTSVTWIGSRGRERGTALVRVDGGSAIEVDLLIHANPEIRTPVLTIDGLPNTQHTLTIEVTAPRNRPANFVVVDAFDVQASTVSHVQEADPDLHFSNGWTEAGGALMWSGGGASNKPEPDITAKVTEIAGETATLKDVRLTGIRWIGYRGPDAGIALVSVDGGAPTPVDLYSPEIKVQEVVFTASGLADAKHTLTITATGQKNAAATAAKVYVDAFDVMSPGRRYQERDLAAGYHRDDPTTLTYLGTWLGNDARVWSEGRAVKTEEPGASVTFSFTGTSVSWIGVEKSSIGTARVFLDDVDKGTVNMRRPVGVEGYQRTIFRADGLKNGPHKLKIVAISGFTVVDAFDVQP